jgi:MFS transporter, ACS family, hexuronate transporter
MAQSSIAESPVELAKPSSRRWLMISLVFLATVINYLDRQALSVAAPVITKEFGLTNDQYGTIVSCFLLAYTIANGVSGTIIDRIGVRVGYALAIAWWSIAAILHMFAIGPKSLGTFRALLGLGEAANWPAGVKVVAENFPPKERALASGIFNSGAAVGAIVAAPLIAFLVGTYGWRTSFAVVGVSGLLWLLLWWPMYRTPAATVDAAAKRATGKGRGLSFGQLLRDPFVRRFTLAKIFLDPVWYFYVFWFPKYLSAARGFDLAHIGKTSWIPFAVGGIGNLAGGMFSAFLVGRGLEPRRARKVAICLCATLMTAAIPAVLAGSAGVAIFWVSIAAFGYTSTLANMLALPGDRYDSDQVASVYGFGSMGSGFGGMIFSKLTGMVIDQFSYVPVFYGFGLMPLLGVTILFASRRER